VFKLTFSFKILSNRYVLIYDMKIIIYFNKPSNCFSIFFLLNSTWHLLETKSPCSKVNVKNYLCFKKIIWKLFLQVEIWKLMHINIKNIFSPFYLKKKRGKSKRSPIPFYYKKWEELNSSLLQKNTNKGGGDPLFFCCNVPKRWWYDGHNKELRFYLLQKNTHTKKNSDPFLFATRQATITKK